MEVFLGAVRVWAREAHGLCSSISLVEGVFTGALVVYPGPSPLCKGSGGGGAQGVMVLCPCSVFLGSPQAAFCSETHC